MQTDTILSNLDRSSYTFTNRTKTSITSNNDVKIHVELACKYNTITYIFRVTVGALACILTLGSAYSSERVANLFSRTYTIWAIDDLPSDQQDLGNTNRTRVRFMFDDTENGRGSISPSSATCYSNAVGCSAFSTLRQRTFEGPPKIDGPLAEFQKLLPHSYSDPALDVCTRRIYLNMKRPELNDVHQRYLKHCDEFKLGYVPKTRLISPISSIPVCANRVLLSTLKNPFILGAHPQNIAKDQITPHHLSALFAADVTLIVDLTHASDTGRNGGVQTTPYCPEQVGEQNTFRIGQTNQQVSIHCLSTQAEGVFKCVFNDFKGISHPFQYWRCDQWDQNVHIRNRDLLVGLAQKLVDYTKDMPDKAIAIHCMDGAGHSAVLATLTAIIEDMDTNPQNWNKKTYLERIGCYIQQGRSQQSPHFIDTLNDLKLLEQATLKLMQDKALAS